MNQVVFFLESVVLLAAVFGCAARIFEGNTSAAIWAALTAVQTIKLPVAYNGKARKA